MRVFIHLLSLKSGDCNTRKVNKPRLLNRDFGACDTVPCYRCYSYGCDGDLKHCLAGARIHMKKERKKM